MMHIATVLLISLQLASCAPHVARGSRKGSMGMGSQVLTSSHDDTLTNHVEIMGDEQNPDSTPFVFLFVIVAVGILGNIFVVEHRRKHEDSAWMADRRALGLYRIMVIISLEQGCLALYKINEGYMYQGLLDCANAVIGFYACNYALSYLKAYLAVSVFTTGMDVLGLLWNGVVCIDIVRPALCMSGIYFAREFLVEKKDIVEKYDGLVMEKKLGNNALERLLNLAVSTSVVQQAMVVLGVIEMDPLIFGASASSPMPSSDYQEANAEKMPLDVDVEPQCSADFEAGSADLTPMVPLISSDLLGSDDSEINSHIAQMNATYDLLGEPAAPFTSDLLEPMGVPTTSDLLDVGAAEFASDDQGFVF